MSRRAWRVHNAAVGVLFSTLLSAVDASRGWRIAALVIAAVALCVVLGLSRAALAHDEPEHVDDEPEYIDETATVLVGEIVDDETRWVGRATVRPHLRRVS